MGAASWSPLHGVNSTGADATSAPGPKLRILLLCWQAARHTGTVAEHVGSFEKYSRHDVVVFDSQVSSELDLDLELFDVIVLHYSLVISMPVYLPPAFFQNLGRTRALKVLFIQDEYRWVDRIADAIRSLGIDVVFTVVNKDAAPKIYRHPWLQKVRFEFTLTGFVPEALIHRKVPPYARRPIDISYRARKLPAWCGSSGLQKWRIGERVKSDASRFGLKVDIASAEASRIYGEAWVAFVANSKAVLGTESGSSFIDYTGGVHEAIAQYEQAHPAATFEEIRDRFLEGRDGQTAIRVISPRCFEAAALRTLMIMYPGEYSGALEAGRHYVPLLPDHSNMAEVVAALRDPERAGAIIDNAYREVACSPRWSFKEFIRHFDRVVAESVGTLRRDDSQFANAEAISAHLTGLRTAHDRRVIWQLRRHRLILLLQTLRQHTRGAVKLLPAPLAKPLLALGRAVEGRIHHWLRRMLLPESHQAR